MAGKIFLISSIILLFAGITHPVFADVSSQFKEAEDNVKNTNYAEAEKIYRQIVTDYPGTVTALQAQEKLACLYVTSGNEPEAQAALEKLKANFFDFPQQELVATAITHVADTYREIGKHQKACEIYTYVVGNWPRAEHGMWSQMGLVIANSCTGNEDGAEVAYAKLCADYSGQQHISRAVCLIADNYCKLEKHKKASELYQYALTNWPNAPFTLWSKMGLAISSIRLREFEDANSIVDKLKTDFAKDERMSVAACQIADEYRKSNKHEKAASLYQYVVNNHPGSEHSLWSQMGLAISNIRIGNEAAAQTAINKLRNDFSQDKRLPMALCSIADEYRRSRKYEKGCELYRYIVNNHPDNEFAFWSQMNLAISNIQSGNDEASQNAIDKLLADFSKDGRMPYAACTIADECRRLNKYDLACELYGYVIDDWPDSEQALWSQMGLAISNIRLADDPNADYDVEELLSRFSKDKRLAVAVCSVADEYRRLKQDNKACRLYQYVVDNNADAEHALWSQMNLAISNITLGDDVGTDTAIRKLLSDFSIRKGVARAINNIAMWYRFFERYEKANQLLQSAIDAMSKRPQLEIEIWPRATIVVSNIGLGDCVSSDTIDKLLTDFNDHPDLPEVMALIAESHWNEAFGKENQGQTEAARAYFQRALANWEIIINRLPETNAITAEAYYFSGQAYQRLGEFKKAMECYEAVVEDWPDCQFSWNAQFMVACCVEELVKAKEIPLAEGTEKIRQACNKVLTNYPDCVASGPAKGMLNLWEKVKTID